MLYYNILSSHFVFAWLPTICVFLLCDVYTICTPFPFNPCVQTSGMCVKPAGGDAPVQSEDFGEYDNPTDYT